jgi:hypothetical protein
MTGFTALPIRLRDTDRAALTEHFLALDADDRRLRFGASLSDDAIRALDERIDFDRDEIFGVAGDDLRLLAVVHVAFYPAKAELGLSVCPAPAATAQQCPLFARGDAPHESRRARVFVHCLSQNGAMMHLATKNGMRSCTTVPKRTLPCTAARAGFDPRRMGLRRPLFPDLRGTVSRSTP